MPGFVFRPKLRYHSPMKRKVVRRKKTVVAMKNKVADSFAQQVAGFTSVTTQPWKRLLNGNPTGCKFIWSGIE